MIALRRRLVPWFVLLWPVVVLSGPNDFLLEPQEGVLLLRNGSTLRGFISKTGDRYLVAFGQSGEARIDAAQVATFFPNLEEAYQYKRREAEGDYAAHVDLARWCLKEQRLAHAADQLLVAETIAGRRPELDLLHQRLLACAAEREPRPTGIAAASSNAESTPPSTSIATPAELPMALRAEFAASIQPLLINRCAAGGCHTPYGQSSYVLLRPRAGNPFTRALTERNLIATLDQVDPASPVESGLVAMARTPHGGLSDSPIVAHQTQQSDLLVRWVRAFAATRKTAIPPDSGLGSQSISTAPRSSAVAPAAWEAGIELPADSKGAGDDGPGPAYTPIDPFDPEIFNRRHHPAR